MSSSDYDFLVSIADIVFLDEGIYDDGYKSWINSKTTVQRVKALFVHNARYRHDAKLRKVYQYYSYRLEGDDIIDTFKSKRTVKKTFTIRNYRAVLAYVDHLIWSMPNPEVDLLINHPTIEGVEILLSTSVAHTFVKHCIDNVPSSQMFVSMWSYYMLVVPNEDEQLLKEIQSHLIISLVDPTTLDQHPPLPEDISNKDAKERLRSLFKKYHRLKCDYTLVYYYYFYEYDSKEHGVYDTLQEKLRKPVPKATTKMKGLLTDIKQAIKDEQIMIGHPLLPAYQTSINHPYMIDLVEKRFDADPNLEFTFPEVYNYYFEKDDEYHDKYLDLYKFGRYKHKEIIPTPATPKIYNIPKNIDRHCSELLEVVGWPELLRVCNRYKSQCPIRQVNRFRAFIKDNNIITYTYEEKTSKENVPVELKKDLWLLTDGMSVLRCVVPMVHMEYAYVMVNDYRNLEVEVFDENGEIESGVGYGNVRNIIQNTIDVIRDTMFDVGEGNTYYIAKDPRLPQSDNFSNINEIYYFAGMFLYFCLANEISLGMRFCNFILCRMLNIKPTKHERIWHYIMDAKVRARSILNLLKGPESGIELLMLELDNGQPVRTKNDVKEYLNQAAKNLSSSTYKGVDDLNYNPHPDRLESFIDGFLTTQINYQEKFKTENPFEKLSLQGLVKCMNSLAISQQTLASWLTTGEISVTRRMESDIPGWIRGFLLETTEQKEDKKKGDLKGDIEFANDLIWFWTGLRQLPQPGEALKISLTNVKMLPAAHTCFYTIDIYKDTTKEELLSGLRASIEWSKANKSVFDD